MKKKTLTKKPPKRRAAVPSKSGDIAVTKRLLDLTKQEIKSDITSLRLETKAGFSKMGAEISDIKAAIFRIEALVEEQNSRNKFVLDGYTSVHDKMTSSDQRIENLEKRVFGKEQE